MTQCDCGLTSGCPKCMPGNYEPNPSNITITYPSFYVKDYDPVMRAIGRLYSIYYRVGGDVSRNRMDLEEALAELMSAYNAWLG